MGNKIRLPQTKIFCDWFNSALPPHHDYAVITASDKTIRVTAEMVRQCESLLAIDAVTLDDNAVIELEQAMTALNSAVGAWDDTASGSIN